MSSGRRKKLVKSKVCPDPGLRHAFNHGAKAIVKRKQSSSWTLIRSSSHVLDEVTFHYGIEPSSLRLHEDGDPSTEEAPEQPAALGILILIADDDPSTPRRYSAGFTVQLLPTDIPFKPGLAATSSSQCQRILKEVEGRNDGTIGEVRTTGWSWDLYTGKGKREGGKQVAILVCTCKDLRVNTYKAQKNHIRGPVSGSDDSNSESACVSEESEGYQPSKHLQVQSTARVTRRMAAVMNGTNGKGKCNEKDNEAGIDSETKKDLQGHVSGNNSKDSKNQEGSDPDPLCSHDNSASGNHSGPAASSNRSGAEDGSQGGDLDEVESGLPVPPTQKDDVVERDNEPPDLNVHASEGAEEANIRDGDDRSTHILESESQGSEHWQGSRQVNNAAGMQHVSRNEEDRPQNSARVNNAEGSVEERGEEHSNDILRIRPGRRYFTCNSDQSVAEDSLILQRLVSSELTENRELITHSAGDGSGSGNLESDRKQHNLFCSESDAKGSRSQQRDQQGSEDEDRKSSRSHRKRSLLRSGADLATNSSESKSKLLTAALAGELGSKGCSDGTGSARHGSSGSGNGSSRSRTRSLQEVNDCLAAAAAKPAEHDAGPRNSACSDDEQESCGSSPKLAGKRGAPCEKAVSSKQEDKVQPRTRKKRKTCMQNEKADTNAQSSDQREAKATAKATAKVAAKGAACGYERAEARTKCSVPSDENAVAGGSAPEATKHRNSQKRLHRKEEKSGSTPKALRGMLEDGDAMMHAEHAPEHDRQVCAENVDDTQAKSADDTHAADVQQDAHIDANMVAAQPDDATAELGPEEDKPDETEDKQAGTSEQNTPHEELTPSQRRNKKRRDKKRRKQPMIPKPKTSGSMKTVPLLHAAPKGSTPKHRRRSPASTTVVKDMHASGACKGGGRGSQQKVHHTAGGKNNAYTAEVTHGAPKPRRTPSHTDQAHGLKCIRCAKEHNPVPASDACMSPTASVQRGVATGGHKRRRCSVPDAADLRCKNAALTKYHRPEIAACVACMRTMHGGARAAHASGSHSPDGEVQSAARLPRLKKVAAGATFKRVGAKKVTTVVPAKTSRNRGAKTLAHLQDVQAKCSLKHPPKGTKAPQPQPLADKSFSNKNPKTLSRTPKRAQVHMNLHRRGSYGKKVFMMQGGQVRARTFWPTPCRRSSETGDMSDDSDEFPPDDYPAPPGGDDDMSEKPQQNSQPDERADKPLSPPAPIPTIAASPPRGARSVEAPSLSGAAPTSSPLPYDSPMALPARIRVRSPHPFVMATSESTRNSQKTFGALGMHASSRSALGLPRAPASEKRVRAQNQSGPLSASTVAVKKSIAKKDRIETQNQALRAHKPKLSVAKLLPPIQRDAQAAGSVSTPLGPHTPSLLAERHEGAPSATCDGFPLVQCSP